MRKKWKPSFLVQVKWMKINCNDINEAFVSLISNPNQIITIDANIIIPPDRRACGAKTRIEFKQFEKNWLEPLFETFSGLSLHEAIHNEILKENEQLRAYIDNKISNENSLVLYKDSDLSQEQMNVRNTIEAKIAPNTAYNPALDNKDDKGEVKTLAFIAAKELLYFASNDANSLNLVERAEELGTSLDNVQTIHYYEIIYYFYKKACVDKESMRMLYKYSYYLTKKERGYNPSWGDFIEQMDTLYGA